MFFPDLVEDVDDVCAQPEVVVVLFGRGVLLPADDGHLDEVLEVLRQLLAQLLVEGVREQLREDVGGCM